MNHAKVVLKSNYKMPSLGKHKADLRNNHYDHDDDVDDDDDSNNNNNNNEFDEKVSFDACDIPIFQRLMSSNNSGEHEISDVRNDTDFKQHKKRTRDYQKNVDELDGEVSDMTELKVKTKRSKNAPLVMRSNRPVSRLRIDSNGPLTIVNKRRDPR